MPQLGLLTFYIKLDLCPVMQSLAAVGSPIRQSQIADGQTAFTPVLSQRVSGAGLDDHPLPHPLDLACLKADLSLQGGFVKLLCHDGLRFLSKHDLSL